MLEVLVRKTETIKRELGGLPKVIEDAVEQRLIRDGIRHRDVDHLRRKIEAESPDGGKTLAAAEEIEEARERREDLLEQIERCQRLLEKSRGMGEILGGTLPPGHQLFARPTRRLTACREPR